MWWQENLAKFVEKSGGKKFVAKFRGKRFEIIFAGKFEIQNLCRYF